jgi:hypothetical protein
MVGSEYSWLPYPSSNIFYPSPHRTLSPKLIEHDGMAWVTPACHG